MFHLSGLDKFKGLSQLRKNVLSGSITATGNFALLLIAYPLYLKYLGAERYGLWAAISIVIFFSRLGDLGINNALVKYIAEKFGQKNVNEITNYITTSFYVLAVPSVLILVLLFWFNDNIAALLNLKPDYIERAQNLIPLTGILTVFILFVELIKGVLMGIGKIDIANYIFLAGRFIQVIVSVSLILAGIGVWGLYYGNVVFYLLIFCVYLYFIIFRYNIDLFKINGFRKNYMKELLSFGGTMFSARAVSMLIEPFNKVIISRYIGLAEISYYEIGLRGASQLRSLYEMGLKAIMPRVSELQQKVVDFKQVIADIYKKSLLFITIFAIPIFAGLFILADIALKLWLGNKYNTQIPLSLRWFLFGYIINLFAIPSYYIFMGIGKTGYCFLAHLITSVANILAVALIVAFNLTSLRLIISIHSFSVILSAIIMIYLFSVIKKDSFIRQSITNGKSEDAEENRQRTTL